MGDQTSLLKSEISSQKKKTGKNLQLTIIQNVLRAIILSNLSLFLAKNSCKKSIFKLTAFYGKFYGGRCTLNYCIKSFLIENEFSST